MNLQVDVERVFLAHKAVRAELLAERSHGGQWAGQLASSPLATAAAISALVSAHHRDSGDTLRESKAGDGQVAEQLVQGDLSELLCESLQWLARHQNADGGWGDCDASRSNLAATMLVQAAFRMTGVPAKYTDLIVRADHYLTSNGGAAGLRRSQAGNKAWVAAVLANCALAGIVPWRQVPSLPFELVCLPKRWREYVQMPYSRLTVPLLLAIGRAKFHHDPPRNPLTRLLRRSMRAKSLETLESLQAADDSYLGSSLITAFIVTSLAGTHCQEHTIVQRGVEYLLSAVRSDASWSIELNHATTNTARALSSLSVEPPATATRITEQVNQASDNRRPSIPNGSAWQESKLAADKEPAYDEQSVMWLLDNQRTEIDPLTEISPGGWALSDTPGAPPNTLATADAIIALTRSRQRDRHVLRERIDRAIGRGGEWLLEMQSDDGGWPTYYGDESGYRHEESGVVVTARVLSALAAWERLDMPAALVSQPQQIGSALESGWRFLVSRQHEDGRFEALWFGNEYQPGDQNPVMGTAQVLRTCGELGRFDTDLARRAAHWLLSAQHSNGGWGPPRARRDYSGTEKDGFRAWRANDSMAKRCSVEETGLAVLALLPLVDRSQSYSAAVRAGLSWLAAAVEQDLHRRPATIGFYPSKLWYHERLYPLVLATGALSRAVQQLAPQLHETAPVG